MGIFQKSKIFKVSIGFTMKPMDKQRCKFTEKLARCRLMLLQYNYPFAISKKGINDLLRTLLC